MLTRNTAPVLGAHDGPYLRPGDWQIGATLRTFRADEQYRGTVLSQPVTRLKTQVISELDLLDLNATYGVSPQLSLSLGVPLILYASSNRALPAGVAGSPRFTQSSKGLGDISLTARYWLLDVEEHKSQNVSLGLGVKSPTGNSNAMDTFPNGAGAAIGLRPVDSSIQLGDGGWGILFDVQAFKQVGSLTIYGGGTYLANPRGQSHTLSPRGFLVPAGPGAVNPGERYNTVSDQYIARLGALHRVPGVKGLAASLGVRLEGVPVNDLIGDTIGFRRPGYVISVEPGLIYTTGQTTFTLSVPVSTMVNVQPQDDDHFEAERDSTFADFIVLLGVSHRLGRGK